MSGLAETYARDGVVHIPGALDAEALHGGAPTHPGTRRRTLTLRFFGADAVYDPREGGAGPRVKGFHDRMQAGDPFRHPSFLKLHA